MAEHAYDTAAATPQHSLAFRELLVMDALSRLPEDAVLRILQTVPEDLRQRSLSKPLPR